MNNMKVPEPITATYKNGKINVFVKAYFANTKKEWSFKGTPKNLAIFGRFIEWENPEIQTEGQPTPPPDNNNNNNMLT